MSGNQLYLPIWALAHIAVRLRKRETHSPAKAIDVAYKAVRNEGQPDLGKVDYPAALAAAIDARAEFATMVRILDEQVLPALWERSREGMVA